MTTPLVFVAAVLDEKRIDHMANNKPVLIKIKRQLTPDAKPSWEEFEIPYKPNMNVTSALMEIAANPVTRDGKQTTPGSYDLGPGPRVTMEDQEKAYPLSSCISCCCCMEACPQFNEDTGFVGAAAISQVRLFNTHPTGQALKRERLSALMGDGGIQECGYAQNCVEICPKDIPLTRSISEVGREVMKQAIGDLFRR